MTNGVYIIIAIGVITVMSLALLKCHMSAWREDDGTAYFRSNSTAARRSRITTVNIWVPNFYFIKTCKK